MPFTSRALLALGTSLMIPTQAQAEIIFSCAIGARQATVMLDGERLTYRFGRPRRPEIVIAGDPQSGNVTYYRELYPRGELQTLRFDRGAYSYVVRSLWMAPSGNGSEYVEGSVSVIQNGRDLRRLECRSGGDMREHPVFGRLPQEEGSNRPE